jgi:hemerythrin-like domain-containing protein
MSGHAVARRTRIERIPAALLDDPLDYMFADHFRVRTVCNRIEAIAAARKVSAPLAAELAAFLVEDLALHLRDEEEGLYPLLRRRCPPEDEVEPLLGQLAAEHAEDERLAEAVRAVLARGRSSGRIGRVGGGILVRFARQQRRHLAIENGVVLPIARLRLLAADLAELARGMAARRGVRRVSAP